MPDSGFVHLHVHTHYSLLDGANKIPQLVARAKELGQTSLAITDHGCMYGVIEFFNECKKQGIKPILGMEAYMAPGDRRERSTPGGNAGEAAFHLLLLAENIEGYRNLIKLSSIAFREGFYYKPRIDKEVLRAHSKGLIATSACLGGEVASALLKRDAKASRQAAETYAEIFGPDRFFIEVQKHIKEQDIVNPELCEVAQKLGVGLVGTNDVHFLTKDDHHAHDVLCCISMNKLVNDEGRMKYSTELYLKSEAEMRTAMKGFEGAIDNTARIAAMCNLEMDFSKRYAPVYRVPPEKLVAWHGRDAHDTRLLSGDARRVTGVPPVPALSGVPEDEQYLRQLCEEGLAWRYGTRDVSQAVRDRLLKEIAVIAGKNFSSYFLIVWDFCNFAREHNIPVGARGSGVGTMVGYLLGLCNVDPLQYGLLFERFMDPSRNEMPDIDIDICQDGRGKVIEYVRQKYGHVAQIITFGTLAAKAACKDVGRVLGVPLAEIDKVTKLIPGVPGMTLDKAMSQVPDLKNLYNTSGQIREVIDLAKKLEGMCRNSGVHAAGVIIADTALDEVIPLCKDKDDNVLTQFEGPIAEKCGLLKMDFLGLRTLSTLTRSLELEKSTRDERPTKWSKNQPTPPLDTRNQIDIEKVNLVDRHVLNLFCRGETKGIFQFESGGMQDLLMKMCPDRVEDLIAANALYRPGPMELIPLYCNRKHGRERAASVHPIMDAILEETYSIMVYQEQVMQIFNQLGGIELSNAYKLIKAISKKTSDVIAKFKPDFLKGATANGISKEKAEEIFDLILKFGGYGFNKSHSTRYAIVAFQTAYMKTYHPVEYMAAVLTFEMGSTEKVVEYIEECRRLTLPDGSKGIRVLPPDVNESDKDFTPTYVRDERKKRSAKEGVIRFGLNAVRGVGEKAAETIIAEREKGAFKSLHDFCERIDLRTVTRGTIEALIKCGAFSSISPNRAQLVVALDGAVDGAMRLQEDKRSGQMAIFGGGEETTRSVPAPSLPNVKEYASADLLKFEKEFLGFYITSHPLTEHQIDLDRYTTASTRECQTIAEGTEVMIGGMISGVKNKVAKSGRSVGQRWAIVEIEDLDGKIEGMVFSDALASILQRYPNAVANEQIVFMKGKVDKKREAPSILVNEIIPIEDAPSKLTTAIALKIDRSLDSLGDRLKSMGELLARHKGNCDVFAQVQTDDSRNVVLKFRRELSVRPSKALVDDFDSLLGSGTTQLVGAGQRRMKRIEQQKLFKEEAAETTPTTLTSDEQLSSVMDSEMLEV